MNSYKTRRAIEYKTIMKGFMLVLISFLFFLCSLTKVLAVEKTHIKLSVDYGYDQYAKYGRYIPVNVTIKNQGKGFSGYLQTYASKAGNNVAYEKKITVKKDETVLVPMTIPILDNSGYLNVNLLNGKKEKVLNRQYALKLGNYDKQMYIGVLSDKISELEYLSSYGTKVFHLDESIMPEDVLGLDLLDVLVINRYDTSKLNQKQISAIYEWIKKGGTIVLGTGEYQEQVLNGFDERFGITPTNISKNLTFSFGTDREGIKEITSKILDYEENRRIFLENINNQNAILTSYGIKPIITDNLEQNMWTKGRLSSLSVEKITKVVKGLNITDGICQNSQDGVQLLTTKKFGMGKIEVFHFSLGQVKELTSSGLSILTAIRSNLSDRKKNLLDNELYGAYMSDGVSSYISHTSSDVKPKILHYTLIIIIYVILVGPILFLILKKLDKSNWYFRSIIGLSLLFMGFVYLMGFGTRINKPYMDYIKVSEFGEKDTVTNNLFFSITGYSNRDVDMALSKGYEVKELSQSKPYVNDYRALKNSDVRAIKSFITYEDTKTKLRLTGLPAFTPMQYQFTRVETAKNKLSSDVSNVGYGLKGKIKNGFNFDIKNAILISKGYIVSLGNVSAGQEVVLDDKYSIYLSSRDDLYPGAVLSKLMQTEGMYNKVEGNRVANLLEHIMEEDINDLSQDSYLLGLKVEKEPTKKEGVSGDTIVSDFSEKYNVYGTEVVKLPVDINYTKGALTFVPSIDTYIVPNDSYYDKYYQARYLSTAETTLTYHFPANDKITRFNFLKDQNVESLSDYISKFTGTIEFLNLRTGKYDQVFSSGYNPSVYNTEDYLTDENILTVKFRTDMSLKAFNMVLPHISYWKEDGYVRN